MVLYSHTKQFSSRNWIIWRVIIVLMQWKFYDIFLLYFKTVEPNHLYSVTEYDALCDSHHV